MAASSSTALSTTLALLTQFEHQYSVNTAEITAKIGQLGQLPASERVAGVNDVRRLLSEVEDLLGHMELSVWELDASGPDRTKYDLRVKSYRNDKKQLGAELQKAIDRLKSSADRDELFSYDDPASLDQEDRLIASTERLERSSRKIHDAYRVTVETEQVGSEVLENLNQQRETLTRARDRMREADTDLTQSSRILNAMLQRVIQSRLTLLVIAIVLMFFLLLLIYRTV